MDFQRIGGYDSHNVIRFPEVSTHMDARKFSSEWILPDFLCIYILVPNLLFISKIVLPVVLEDSRLLNKFIEAQCVI
jgi:hypothetical protein